MRGADPSDELLIAQTGVARVDSLDELLDVARILAWQPLPQSRAVVVVADAPGTAAFAVDACATAGLEPLDPIVVGVGADADAYRRAVDTALADPDAGAALVIHASPVGADSGAVAAAIGEAVVAMTGARAVPIPVIASLPATDVGGRIDGAGARPVPVIRFPDRAARALAVVAGYAAWRDRPAGIVPDLEGVDIAAARAIVVDALVAEPEGGPLPTGSAVELVRSLGVRVVEQREVGSAAEAARAAEEIGCPVALKARGRAPTAKTELAGVALDLHEPADVAGSYERMVEALGEAATSATVQAMLPPGGDVAGLPRAGADRRGRRGDRSGRGRRRPSSASGPAASCPSPTSPPPSSSAAGIGEGLGPEGSAAVADVALRLARGRRGDPRARRDRPSTRSSSATTAPGPPTSTSASSPNAPHPPAAPAASDPIRTGGR